jgi:hypothetical protein
VLATEPATAGPTMALRPGVSWADGRSELRSASGRSRSSPSRPRAPEPQSQASSAGAGTSRRDRIWVYGGLTILASVMVAGAWLLARPAEMAGAGTAQAPVDTTSAPAAIELPAKPAAPADPAPAPIPASSPSQVTPIIEAAATNTGSVAPVVEAAVAKSAAPTAADASSWKALSRTGKGKSAGARRAHRDKPAAAADSDTKDKADGDPLPGSKKPDPFAD